MPTSTQDLLGFAIDAAWQAGQLTLSYFQKGIHVDWKADDSPVTLADKNAEQLLRQLIEAKYPDHAIVGEEYGQADKDSSHRWIIDPIDGTRSFIRGVPLYAVLIGLEIADEVVVGVAHYPALNEMLAAAKGQGCRWNGRPARVSQTDSLAQALICYTDVKAFAEYDRSEEWGVLLQATHTQRGWSDAYGHALVATGRAEGMFDPIMNPWDCGPFLPILQEAGGTFTDWQGKPTIYGDEAISTNGAVFDEVMALVGNAK